MQKPYTLKIKLPSRKKYPVLAQYQNQHTPQPAYLEFTPDETQRTRTLVLSADYSGEIGNSVPAAVFHDFVFRFAISPHLDRHALKALERDDRLLNLVGRLQDSYSASWYDGHYRGLFDRDLADMIREHLSTIHPEG
jgi:hypothetical protein